MIKMAIVGAGRWGGAHARIFSEMAGVECVAICDLNRERAERLRIPGHIESFGTADISLHG